MVFSNNPNSHLGEHPDWLKVMIGLGHMDHHSVHSLSGHILDEEVNEETEDLP